MATKSPQNLRYNLPSPTKAPFYWLKLMAGLNYVLVKIHENHRFPCRFPGCQKPVSGHEYDFCLDCFEKIKPSKDSKHAAICSQCCVNPATKDVIRPTMMGFQIGNSKVRYKWCEACFKSREEDSVPFWKPADYVDCDERLKASGYLGNWQKAEFVLGDLRFQHVEQFMMFCKALIGRNPVQAYKIYQEPDPRACQKMARADQVTELDVQSYDILAHVIVTIGLYGKFVQNEELMDKLLATEQKRLIEVSPYDKIWGVGLSIDDPDWSDPAKWQSAGKDKPGPNVLGRCLMGVRRVFQSGHMSPEHLLNYVSNSFNLAGEFSQLEDRDITGLNQQLKQNKQERIRLQQQLRELEDEIRAHDDRVKKVSEMTQVAYTSKLKELKCPKFI